MSLKTLKDLIPCNKRTGVEGSTCENCGFDHMFSEELLRVNAIKWVKLFSGKTAIPKGLAIGEFGCYEEEYEATINWIKFFFNLGEKDLEELK